MAILFAGTEDTDFINVSADPSFYSTSISFAYRQNMVRGGLWVYSAPSSSTPGWIRTPTFQVQDNPIWLSARMGYPSSTYADGGAYLRFFSGPNIVAELRANANNSVSLFLRNSSGALAFVAETAPRVFTYYGGGNAEDYSFKFDYNLNLSTTGHFRMYLGGKAVINHTGNTLGDLAPTTRIDQVHLGTGRTGSGGLVWSEIIVATTDTRTMALMSLPPTSLNFNQWTGTVSDINENIMNTSTNLTSLAADDVVNIKIKVIPSTTALLPYNMEVQTLVVSGAFSQEGAQPSKFAIGHSNANGTTIAYASPTTPPSGMYDVFSRYFDMNYIDNAKWTPASLASMHISLKSS